MLPFKRSSDRKLDRWFWSIDIKIIFTILILLLIGIILDLSASPYVALRLHAYPLYFFVRHILYVFLAVCIMIGMSFLTEEQVKKLGIFIFVMGCLAILATLIFNIEVKGARRWIHLFGFSLQPSEFVKITFPIVLASIWDKLRNKDRLAAYLLMSIVYIMLAGMLIMQPDLGMTILISVIFAGILFITEVSLFWVLLLACLGVVLLVSSYFAFNHVQYRIDTFFSGEKSYQIEKALEAIADGGFWGVGAGNGLIKEYLPDAHTDFIFAVAVEEYGAIFAIVLIGIYSYLFFRIYKLIKIANNNFNYICLIGFLIILIIQTFIHISTNINLIPTKGVTLPFISYGGTSLVSSAILTGFLLSLSRKKY
ncbi:FtsW/RodA/SpoVE family cell cycle protein [Rickettsiales bacterium LUAb2]